jgi:hypothetical protein
MTIFVLLTYVRRQTCVYIRICVLCLVSGRMIVLTLASVSGYAGRFLWENALRWIPKMA